MLLAASTIVAAVVLPSSAKLRDETVEVVGGEVLPTNVLELLMPYLLAAAVIMVGAAAILKKRRL